MAIGDVLVRIRKELELLPHLYQRRVGADHGLDIRIVVIGGKAAGKSIAIEQSANIVLFVGKTMALFERKTTKRKKNKKN